MLGGRCDHREGGKGALAMAEWVRARGGGRARGRWGALASAGGGRAGDTGRSWGGGAFASAGGGALALSGGGHARGPGRARVGGRGAHSWPQTKLRGEGSLLSEGGGRRLEGARSQPRMKFGGGARVGGRGGRACNLGRSWGGACVGVRGARWRPRENLGGAR